MKKKTEPVAYNLTTIIYSFFSALLEHANGGHTSTHTSKQS